MAAGYIAISIFVKIFSMMFASLRNNVFTTLLFLVISFSESFGQTPVLIPVATENNLMLLGTDKQNRLRIVYFGAKPAKEDDYSKIATQYFINDNNAGIYNAAYTTAGTYNLVEPALQVKHYDGNLSLDLKYKSFTTNKNPDDGQTITVLLQDEVYPVQVKLFYRTWPKENVVEQWAEVSHTESDSIILSKYASANLYFVAEKFILTHFHGTWAKEMQPVETELSAGIMSLDSKLGTRANLYQSQNFMVSFDKVATETEGKVLIGSLGWTGNFKIDFEIDSWNNLRLIAGINPYASAYTLAPSKIFRTPSLVYTYSEKGTGIASRNLHHWAIEHRIADGKGTRLSLLNNWEATYFDFDEPKLKDLFKDAKNLGVDLFLLDDGWFANKYPRNGDNAGLGDWQENKKKLPNGIGYLVREAEKAGVKFGIWVEPEMVNPKSELYETHKDWVLRQNERPEIYFRNQLVLDLSNPEVQQFVYSVLDSMFYKNPKLSFIKWDCNAVIYNAYSMYLQKAGLPQSHLYVDYVQGLYSVLEKLRKKYPSVPMMLCSGGGGRADYEALRYFTEFWPSDNTDPLERIYMQWNYSYFFPALVSCNHVTDWGKQPIKFKTDVAMMGKLGFDIVVSKLDEKDAKFAKSAVTTYNSIKETVWRGDLYRIENPYKKPTAVLFYVSKSKKHGVLFSYLTTERYGNTSSRPSRLSGLDPAKDYQVKEINLYPGTNSPFKTAVYSGDYLMTIGINPRLSGARKSVVLELVEI